MCYGLKSDPSVYICFARMYFLLLCYTERSEILLWSAILIYFNLVINIHFVWSHIHDLTTNRTFFFVFFVCYPSFPYISPNYCIYIKSSCRLATLIR